MRTTQVLFKHHIGRMISFQWYLRGRVQVIPTATEEILKSHGHEVMDINELLFPPRKKEKLDVVGLFDKEIPKNENHPDYRKEPCLIFKNEDVPIEGLQQAKVLTNTVEICKGLPETVIERESKLNLPEELDLEAMKRIKLCCMLDATQEKLPKRKDPERPAWDFPRDYGIPEVRRNNLLCQNLISLCEQFSKTAKDKSIILDAFFSTPIEAHNKKIQFELTSELVVMGKQKFKALVEPSSTHDLLLPQMGPVHCSVGMKSYNFYDMKDLYPVRMNSKWPYIQMAFIHFNKTQVKNILEEEVTETQIYGQSLLNGFCLAAAEARAAFGDVKALPEPLVVPLVQINGEKFHFSIFQLNTLDLDGDSQVKNIFWNSPAIPLYSVCEYKSGRPVLSGYNPDVLKRLISFYNFQ